MTSLLNSQEINTIYNSTPSGKTFFQGVMDNNPYFQAGFGLMGVGFGLTILRQGILLGTAALRRRMLVSLEINNRDRSYDWFLSWMAQQPNSIKSNLFRSHHLSAETTVEQMRNGSSSAMFKLVAGPGIHWFKYKDAWIQLKRERETRSAQLVSGQPWETVTLTTLSQDRALLTSLLSDARDLAVCAQNGKLVIQTAWGTEWRPFGQPRLKKPMRSIVLEPGVKERIADDVRSFLERRRWYTDRGIPYRRGYLLHGSPGSGKTSLIKALASSLSYDICLLNLSERGLTDDKLIHLLSNAPERSFILIEDVDAAFNKRVQTNEDGYQSSVTFSGFLNALDGVASAEERIIFMTTNHIKKLDPALIRPGRVDLTEIIDDASPLQACQLFEQFYAGNDVYLNEEVKKQAKRFGEIVEVEILNGKTTSMAALQGLFITNDSKEALAACREIFVPKVTGQSTRAIRIRK